MKVDKWIKIGIGLTATCLAVMAGSLIYNQLTKEKLIVLGEPEFPRISFQVEDQKMNYLSGYADEMEITAMRDTITPVTSSGRVKMYLDDTQLELTEVAYKVYSLDGTEVYLEDSCTVASTCELDLSEAFQDDRTEMVLQVILKTEEQEISYYTRIEKENELNLDACLDFAQNFHEMTFDTANEDTILEFLEPGEKSDNTTLQTVDIHSNAYHICWGDLEPEITTDVEWSIKESNNSYTSLLAEYQVTCADENETVETYNIREFFRVRLSKEEMYLLNYDRTMNQVFDETSDFLTEYTLELGMADSEMEYAVNEKGTLAAFVQERELWLYNKKGNDIIQVFSFNPGEKDDIRNRNDEHAIRIIEMDNSGNIVFAVSGYMNSGNHEGQVGVAIYFYDISQNLIEEKAFIQSTKSFAIAEDELGKMIYCNQEQQMLYVLTDGTLYQIEMENNRQEILAENLGDEQYVVCEDGHLLAYQTNGDLNTATEIQVMDLSTEESYLVKAGENEAIRPLGFITGDFICGYVRAEDQGATVTGEEVFPMYKMEIMEGEDKVAKTYAQDGIYISDVWVDANQVTLNRMVKEGGVYTATTRDYITNTEEKNDAKIQLEEFSTERKEKQLRFVFEEEIKKLEPVFAASELKVIRGSVSVAFESEVKTDQYYVYGLGKMEGIYDNAAQAIQEAEEISGVVISSEQEYIWETGNRDLGFYIDNEPFTKAEGQTSLDACLQYMEQYEADRMDLAGCSLSQVMYVINRGLPMIVMTSADHAVLIVGYNWNSIYYIDPDTGTEVTVTQSQMSEIAEAAGNMFIGFK